MLFKYCKCMSNFCGCFYLRYFISSFLYFGVVFYYKGIIALVHVGLEMIIFSQLGAMRFISYLPSHIISIVLEVNT